jgi:hypothetical protein
MFGPDFAQRETADFNGSKFLRGFQMNSSLRTTLNLIVIATAMTAFASGCGKKSTPPTTTSKTPVIVY